jgi:hypothetical protein
MLAETPRVALPTLTMRSRDTTSPSVSATILLPCPPPVAPPDRLLSGAARLIPESRIPPVDRSAAPVPTFSELDWRNPGRLRLCPGAHPPPMGMGVPPTQSRVPRGLGSLQARIDSGELIRDPSAPAERSAHTASLTLAAPGISTSCRTRIFQRWRLILVNNLDPRVNNFDPVTPIPAPPRSRARRQPPASPPAFPPIPPPGACAPPGYRSTALRRG